MKHFLARVYSILLHSSFYHRLLHIRTMISIVIHLLYILVSLLCTSSSYTPLSRGSSNAKSQTTSCSSSVLSWSESFSSDLFSFLFHS
ncbi:hypothetical protein CSUI_010426 [Cystoisospora suis]|uniref:Transmembrane protein n=1 Tax=Cystoisospora suis TaxID=483139 RepID=A0A2C6JBF1_9APIC|nr:hypothetical protein CSUI_010426 [Cystoisospora suis]